MVPQHVLAVIPRIHEDGAHVRWQPARVESSEHVQPESVLVPVRVARPPVARLGAAGARLGFGVGFLRQERLLRVGAPRATAQPHRAKARRHHAPQPGRREHALGPLVPCRALVDHAADGARPALAVPLLDAGLAEHVAAVQRLGPRVRLLEVLQADGAGHGFEAGVLAGHVALALHRFEFLQHLGHHDVGAHHGERKVGDREPEDGQEYGNRQEGHENVSEPRPPAGGVGGLRGRDAADLVHAEPQPLERLLGLHEGLHLLHDLGRGGVREVHLGAFARADVHPAALQGQQH
mmetsp:Transcript_19041/g.53409  ORF Transcript_19041/g.53409 Transcript_19041/m.53409 type:complete len:293 (-) Transcript_19041:346-1224(-)